MGGKKEIYQYIWFFHGALQLVLKRCYMYRRNTNRHYLYPYLSLYMTISICKCTVDFCVFYNCKNSHQSGRGWCHIRIWTKFARNLGSAMTSRYSFNGHFQRQSGQWEAAVTTRAIRHAKLQSNHHQQQTNVQHFTGRMPFLSPVQQCRTMEGKSITVHRLSHPWSSNLVICHWRNWNWLRSGLRASHQTSDASTPEQWSENG